MLQVRQYKPVTDSEDEPRKKQKRQREVMSCAPCRLRKIACDRQRPCQNCLSRRREAECTYDDAPATGQTPVSSVGEDSTPSTQARIAMLPGPLQSSDALAHIDHRLARIENRLDLLQRSVDVTSTSNAVGGGRIRSVSAVRSGNPYAGGAILNNTHAAGTTIYWGSHHWKKPIAEDMAYLSTASQSRPPSSLELPDVGRQLSELQTLSAHFSADRRKTMWQFIAVQSPSSESAMEHELRDLLPSRENCESAVSRFMSTVNQIYCIIDLEDMARQARDFWDSSMASASPQWIVLYLGVVALGCQLPYLDAEGSLSNRMSRNHGKQLFDVVRRHVVEHAQKARTPTLMGFQSVLLVILQEKLDLDWVDGDDLTSGLLGLLDRMALALGLHRDPEAVPGDACRGNEYIRRQLHWSSALLGFEHSLQCGVPWISFIDSSDVEVPAGESSSPWFLSSMARIVPIGSRILRLFHSKQADVSQATLDGLDKQLAHIDATIPDRSTSPDNNLHPANVVVRVQHAVCICLVSQLRIMLHWPSASVAVGELSTDTICHLVTSVLDSTIGIINALKALSAEAQSIWTHFIASLLRCPLYHTCSIAIITTSPISKIPPTASNASDESATLCNKVKIVLDFLEGTVTSSFECLKQSIFSQTQFRTLDERAQIAGNSIQSDPESTEWKLLLLATQQAMQYCTQRARIAIDRARTQADPPPNLLLTPSSATRPSSSRALDQGGIQSQNGRQNQLSAPEQQIDLLDVTDPYWCSLFDEWFGDVDPHASQ